MTRNAVVTVPARPNVSMENSGDFVHKRIDGIVPSRGGSAARTVAWTVRGLVAASGDRVHRARTAVQRAGNLLARGRLEERLSILCTH